MPRTEVDDGFAAFSEMVGEASAAAEREAVDPAVARRRGRRRLVGLIATGVVGLIVVGTAGGYAALALSAPLPEVSATIAAPLIATPAAVALTMPRDGSSAISLLGAEAFGGTAAAGGILAQSGSPDAVPIASISKVITAMVILDAKPLAVDEFGPTISFDKADADLYEKYFVAGATVASMRRDSSVTQRAALELILIASASNYAEAVSTWAFGSQSAFLRATRVWLDARGLTATTIVEPTGLDPRNVSTPAELIELGRLALADPTVSTIVSRSSVILDGVGTIDNTNVFLGDEGINGIKTGTLDEAGACLLFSASVSIAGADAPFTVIGVVLGQPDQVSAGRVAVQLISDLRAGFTTVPLIAEGDRLGTYETAWGATADIVSSAAASLPNWSDAPITSTASTPDDLGAAPSGRDVGTVTFTGATETITVPLVLASPLEAPDVWWSLTHPKELLGW